MNEPELRPDYSSPIPYFYVFIRKDLPLTYRMIQVGHACYEMGKALGSSEPTHMCLLEVESELELIRIKKTIRAGGITCHMFYEPSYDTGYTSIATEPLIGEARKLFEQFRRYVD